MQNLIIDEADTVEEGWLLASGKGILGTPIEQMIHPLLLKRILFVLLGNASYG